MRQNLIKLPMPALNSVVQKGLDLVILQVAGPTALHCQAQLTSRTLYDKRETFFPLSTEAGAGGGHPVLSDFKQHRGRDFGRSRWNSLEIEDT